MEVYSSSASEVYIEDGRTSVQSVDVVSAGGFYNPDSDHPDKRALEPKDLVAIQGTIFHERSASRVHTDIHTVGAKPMHPPSKVQFGVHHRSPSFNVETTSARTNLGLIYSIVPSHLPTRSFNFEFGGQRGRRNVIGDCF